MFSFMFDLFKDIQFFLSKKFKSWMVKILHLNYGYVIIICFVILHRSNQFLPNKKLTVKLS